jgi:3',5'-cyclic AMP phosphodiesterase CpdA
LLRPVPGNHEYLTPGAAGYFDFFNGAGVQRGRAGDRAQGGYYSFDAGAWHIVALNSNCREVPGGCDVGSPQQQWLARDLARNPRPCTLAFWHHPLFSSLAHEEGRGSKQTLALWQTLYDARADLVLSGHQHFYERLQSQDAAGNLDSARGIRTFVVGTGGKGLDGRDVADRNSVVFHNESFGVLELELHARHYEWRYHPTNGDPFTDVGSAVCH